MYIIYRDALSYFIRAKLMQQQYYENLLIWTMLGIWVKTPTDPNISNSNSEIDFISVVWYIRALRPYI